MLAAAAVRLLAGREYSIKELSTKLTRRFPDAVANVVAEMQSQGYVSDARYGEAFLSKPDRPWLRPDVYRSRVSAKRTGF